MRLGYLKDNARINEVMLLVAKVFYSGDKEKIFIPKLNLKANNIIIMENDQSLIIGACIIVERELFMHGKLMKASFLSFVCIDEEYRGHGLSRKLINYTIKECKKRKHIISLVIARKLVDNFYHKFNFFGISQYSNIKLNLNVNNSKKKFSFHDLKEIFFQEINNIYNSTYSKTLGAFQRDKNYWSYINQKANSLGLNTQAIMKNKHLQGYIIFDKKRVYEIALIDKTNYLDVLSELALVNKIDKEININCSLEHPINLWTNNIDYSISMRQCNFGGHMVRINDWKYLKKNLSHQIDKRLKMLSSIKNDVNLIDMQDINYENASLLLTSNILSSSNYSRDSLFKSFNIPLMDQI